MLKFLQLDFYLKPSPLILCDHSSTSNVFTRKEKSGYGCLQNPQPVDGDGVWITNTHTTLYMCHKTNSFYAQ